MYKDIEESPIKGYPVKKQKARGISKEDEEELEHLLNITKQTKEPMLKEDIEEEIQKPLRKVKPNRAPRFEETDSYDRSPSKVAVRLRVPLTERNYGFRNRESLKTKEIF